MNFKEVVDFLNHEDMTETVVSPMDQSSGIVCRKPASRRSASVSALWRKCSRWPPFWQTTLKGALWGISSKRFHMLK